MDKLRLAAVVREADGFFRVKDLGLCERVQGGFGAVVPQETVAIVEQLTAEKLASELREWAAKGRCALCGKFLGSEDPLSVDCGGDCLGCMAECEDPQAVAKCKALKKAGLIESVPRPRQ
jgi:hypothetical protein